MLSTTLHLTTDIVAMPLLWVVPLGLYLLSFSVAFAASRGLADLFKRIAPITLLIAACGVFIDDDLPSVGVRIAPPRQPLRGFGRLSTPSCSTGGQLRRS